MFRDAVKQNIVLELRSKADWDRFKAIDQNARRQTTDEVGRFTRDHPKLLAAARKDIIDQAGSLTYEHPTPFGIDRFDKSAIERQAKTRVVNAHQTQLLKIKGAEADAYDALKHDIHSREGVRDMARDAFIRSTDRREGGERRGPERDR
jgi:hypothetical protein